MRQISRLVLPYLLVSRVFGRTPTPKSPTSLASRGAATLAATTDESPLVKDARQYADVALPAEQAQGMVCPVENFDFGRNPEQHGFTVRPLHPIGGEVLNMDLRKKPSEAVLADLQSYLAHVGFLVFRDQQGVSGEEQVAISEYFGGRKIHSTHGVHPHAPNRHIFRLSNNPQLGIVGVGPQWHNDGSFERYVFSHVGYYMVKAPKPEFGGQTHFASTSMAYERLSAEEQAAWGNMVSINSNGGIVHPLVLTHPISGKKHVYLHLGMTGAVLDTRGSEAVDDWRLLNKKEMTALFNRYNDLLQDPALCVKHQYETGDFIVIDNLAVSHRADASAHVNPTSWPGAPPSEQEDLRIMHRTTVKGMVPLDPGFDSEQSVLKKIPYRMNIEGPNPLNRDGVWIAGGVGFRWDPKIQMRN